MKVVKAIRRSRAGVGTPRVGTAIVDDEGVPREMETEMAEGFKVWLKTLNGTWGITIVEEGKTSKHVLMG